MTTEFSIAAGPPGVPGHTRISVDLEDLYRHFGAGSADGDSLVIPSELPLSEGFTLSVVPELAQPVAFNPDELGVLMSRINISITAVGAETAMLTLTFNSERRREQLEEAERKRQEAAEAARQAEEAAQKQMVAGWVRAVFAVIGAIIGVVLAAAFGGPLAAIAAGIGAVMALQDLTNMAVQQAGVKVTGPDGQSKQLDVSFAGMVDAMVEADIQRGTIVVIRQNAAGDYVDKNGNVIADPRLNARPGVLYLTEKQVADMKMGLALAITLVLTAATLALGFAAIHRSSHLDKLASDASKMLKSTTSTQRIERFATGVEAMVSAMEGTAAIVEATYGLAQAQYELTAAEKNALKDFLKKIAEIIALQMGEGQEYVKALVERLNDLLASISRMVADTANNQELIAHNMA